MPRRHAAKLLCLLLVAPFAGCGGHLAEAPAPGTSLAGAWKLNPTTSDDPQKVIERMRAEALQRMARREQTAPLQQPATHHGGAHGAGGATDTQESTQQDVVDPGRHLDPLRNSQMMHVLASALARGDFLTVRISAGEVVFDYGSSVRSFSPGGRSVVSAEGGVGDQTSGWSGRNYVIRLRAQMGPDVAENYALSADGKHLIETLRIGPAELPVVNLMRVYDPTSETAPRNLPTND
jgi:hypothetical protein